jgi:hypothetical protein
MMRVMGWKPDRAATLFHGFRARSCTTAYALRAGTPLLLKNPEFRVQAWVEPAMSHSGQKRS